MAICLLDAVKENDERVRVNVLHYKPERLAAERRAGGIMLEKKTVADIPQPEAIKGKTPVLYVNPKTGEFWHEYIDRPLTQEELMTGLMEKIDQLLDNHDELLAELKNSNGGGVEASK